MPKPTLHFIKTLNYRKHVFPVVFVILFAVIGSVLLFGSKAAGPYASLEPEGGTISNGATSVTDGTASNNSYVKFGVGSGGSSGTYTVVGSKIENSSGQAVQIHGVSLSSTEWSCNGEGNFPASEFAIMRNQWNADAVRIPLFQDMWLSNASDYCSSYASNIAGWVAAAEANHMIVILDLHWSDQGNLNYTPQESNQQCMADNNSNTFWQQVASTYKNDPNVWFELYNEPQLSTSQWGAWLNGDSTNSTCGFPIVGMQTLYNTVRATGANNIVIAGGVGYASNLAGVPLISGSNVVYAIHPYSYSDPNADGSGAGGWWDTNFGYLAENNTAPVIATEFGETSCGGAYDQAILNYFRAHGIGYTAWAWLPNGCGYPSIISNLDGTCLASMGCTIQADMKNYSAGP